MSARVLDLLDLAFRWVHVIAGIMWIGNSLLFNWLDRNLRPSSRNAGEVYGDIWLLHSGAFYFVEKTSLSGQPMPRPTSEYARNASRPPWTTARSSPMPCRLI